MSNALVNFIKKHVGKLKNSELGEANDSFIHDCLVSALSVDDLRELLQVLKLEKMDIPLEELGPGKVKLMIEEGYFEFTARLYEDIRRSYPDLLLEYIIYNQQDYIQNLDTAISLDVNLFEQLLLHTQMKSENIVQMLERFGEKLITDATAKILLEQNYKLTLETFKAAWRYLVDDEDKGKLFFEHLDILEADDFQECFAEMKEYSDLYKRENHQVRIPLNEQNELLAKRLKTVNYLTSYQTEKNHIVCRVKKIGGKSLKQRGSG